MPTWWNQVRSRWAVFLHDIISIPIAWFGAYWLRFNLASIPSDIFIDALIMLPWVVVFQAAAFWWFGLYRGVWRFASIPDLSRIIKAILVGIMATLLGIFLVMRLQHLPRSVLPLYGMLLLLILGGSRFIYRWLKDKHALVSAEQKRVLVVGAGRAGDSLVRDLKRNGTEGYLPIVFVDDRPSKVGREIHGLRVVGSTNDIPRMVRQYAIDAIMIALPSANSKEMRRIVNICEATRKPVRTLPSMNDLVSGFVTVKSLRNISIDDLLGRDPVTLDWNKIKQAISNQIVLVSGGGGSIGSELCRQIIHCKPKKLIIFDNSEYHLFLLQQEFEKHSDVQLAFHLLDLCDTPAVWNMMQLHKPNVVFHAAAYKHVPMLEYQARQAVRNNILGTYGFAEIAVMSGVEKFVLVSTDKAVNPTNIMGASKRAAEMVCQYFNEKQKTQFITVRFGNVLGSRGSVVETFKKQLEQGKALTVTHPEVTRYFMTTQEASQLILQALSLGKGGELFVLDMGEPIKIRFMAEQMIRLSGKLDDELKIVYTGLRPGEKLYEELFHRREELISTTHAKILKANARQINSKHFESIIFRLQQACAQCQEQDILQALQAIVPELSIADKTKISQMNAEVV